MENVSVSGVGAHTEQDEELIAFEDTLKVKEHSGLSLISDDGRPCAVCEFCDSSKVLFHAIDHHFACYETGGLCLGRPYCPVLIEEMCPFCEEDGFVYFDYCYYRIAYRYTFSKSQADKIKTSWIKQRREIKKQIHNAEAEQVGKVSYKEVSKSKESFIFSCLCFGIDHGQEIIDAALTASGFPAYAANNCEVFHIRKFYGMFEPYGVSRFHNPAMGKKYVEFQNKIS